MATGSLAEDNNNNSGLTRDNSVDTSVSNSPVSTAPTSISEHEVEETKKDTVLSETILKEEEEMAKNTIKEQEKRMNEEAQAQFDTTVKEQRMKRLNFLLEKSGAYATILGRKLAKQQEEAREKAAVIDKLNEQDRVEEQQVDTKRTTRKTRRNTNNTTASKKRKTNDADYQLTDYLKEDDVKRRKQSDNSISKAIAQEKADNAGVKPIIKPTISSRQPSLVTGGALRDYQLAGVEWLISLWENGLNGILADEMGLGKTLQTISFLAHLKSMQVSGPYLIVAPLSTLANWVNEFKRFAPSINVILYHGSKEERQHMINRKMPKKKETSSDFPVVVTSYEIIMNDRKHLQRYNWKYIVVDEGHRIKNMNCRLIKELKTYSSANRLLLTGTPLQNNLAELWSLLNFLLPDIFDDLDMFQSWFDFSDIHQKSGQDRIMKEEEEDSIVSSLHTILRPFLLRRLKSDVERSLPKKKEYLLYAPLTQPQKALYDAIIKRDIRGYLIKRKANINDTENNVPELDEKRNNKKNNVSYKEVSDRQFFKELEQEKPSQEPVNGDIIKKEEEMSQAIRQVNGMHLQNIVMQLRKVCNHPFLFDWPIDPQTSMPILNNELAAQSGKVLLLDCLLTALFKRGHKVLVFSQMTKMLDILEDWAVHLKKWNTCRLDGAVSQENRRQQIETFQDPESNVNLFLLSTRAGGLGINLTVADTVIIFDSDWNPQMDLQAQDRVHRIGQTKPVLIYRLVAAKTVEDKILERASAKRRLEKLVISKGKFKSPVNTPSAKRAQENTIRELADILASEDGEHIQVVAQGDKVISDENLEKLLDRSPEVFESSNKESNQQFREMDASELRDSKNEILATRT